MMQSSLPASTGSGRAECPDLAGLCHDRHRADIRADRRVGARLFGRPVTSSAFLPSGCPGAGL